MMQTTQPEIVVRVDSAGAAGVVPRRVDPAPDANLVARPVRSRTRLMLWWVVGLAICLGWDRALWLALSRAGIARFEWIEDLRSWGGFIARLRQFIQPNFVAIAEALGTIVYAVVYGFGQIWIWVLIAIVLIGRDWAKPDTDKVRFGLRRAVFLFAPPAAAGLAAEILKVLVRRMRPEHADGFYRFKPFSESTSLLSPNFWNAEGLSMASSHAAVAFGGALAAGILWPRARWWLLGLATLTALSRVLVGAHFVSDVYVGATFGALACAGFYAWDRRNHAGAGL